MNIVSFGGFVHNEEVPKGAMRNTQAGVQASQIVEALKKMPASEIGKASLLIKVTDFGPYERYALQTRLQARGLKVVCKVDGERDAKGVIKSGTLYIMTMTDAQWKAYQDQPGNSTKKK